MSKEVFIPSITSFCIKAFILCFKKWKESSCIFFHIVNNIPTISHYLWTKKARKLTIRKHKNKISGKIRKFYWENVHFSSTLAIKPIIFKIFRFGFKNFIQRLSLNY